LRFKLSDSQITSIGIKQAADDSFSVLSESIPVQGFHSCV